VNSVVPTQHPAVVLRSHYVHMRMLLAVAMIAVVGLSGAVVILAGEERDSITASSPQAIPALPGNIRYDGGPEEGTRGIARAIPAPSPGVRYDGGPEEGTRAITSAPATTLPGVRYDGGPEEGTRGLSLSATATPGTRYDGGPDEGSRGAGH
jgi:hypothetical protein